MPGILWRVDFIGKSQPVTVTGDEVYKIEKVIRTIKKGQPTQYLVRWLGWGPKYDSYIDEA